MKAFRGFTPLPWSDASARAVLAIGWTQLSVDAEVRHRARRSAPSAVRWHRAVFPVASSRAPSAVLPVTP